MLTTGLDHIILGINDLDRGVAWVEQLTGVRAVWGGVHPGRGTRNALLALGTSSYLEIIAPDPGQRTLSWFTQLPGMTEPKLLTWAAHTSDLGAAAKNAEAAGLMIDGPHQGARTCPDGRILRWRLFYLGDNRGGLLPFFIEWGHDSVHPALDASTGCNLDLFQLQSPDAPKLARLCQTLSINVRVEPGARPLIRALIASPRGEVELTS